MQVEPAGTRNAVMRPVLASLVRRPRLTSLRQRLIIIYMVTTAVALLLIATALVVNEYGTYRNAIVDQLIDQAKAISRASAPSLRAGDRQALVNLLADLTRKPDVANATIFDDRGAVVAEYPVPTAGSAADASARAGAPSLLAVAIVQPIPFDGPRAGSVRIEADLGSLYRHLAWYALVFFLAGIAAIGTALLLTDRLLASASRPLLQLVALMERVSNDKDFSVRARIHEQDEVGALAQGFNKMLHRIERRERELRRQLSERKRAERRLTMLAHYDPLTHLPNRNYFNQRLNRVLVNAGDGRLVALLFLDLDNFKIVNDTLGHQHGDALLKAVAARLRDCVRSGDCVCRLGGDEFTIILENIAAMADVEQIAASIVSAMSQPIALDDNEVYVTSSVGISVYPKDGRDAVTLIKNGDAAMYSAKERGKNNYQLFSIEMTDRARKRLMLETGLRQALERGEFILYYQSQVDLRSGDIVAAEALLRWQRPGVGIVGPQDVIPVAEETGLIVPIGEWVLWAACSQAKQWRNGRHKLARVAVNISARQFRENDFVRTVAHVLEETQLEPSFLELELTESALMEDVESAIAKACELRAMGVHLSIDDFGTGYSSISYLQRFPISDLKIDRSFVCDLPTNADDVEITKAIIAMARGLNVEVVAEGVETRQQVEFLAAHGCDRAQGFFIDQALPAAEFEARLRRRRNILRIDGGPAWIDRDAA